MEEQQMSNDEILEYHTHTISIDVYCPGDKQARKALASLVNEMEATIERWKQSPDYLDTGIQVTRVCVST
jgi:S-adenosylmethionine/arginine decarboxylase-like enzyme